MVRTSDIRKVSSHLKKIVAFKQNYKCNMCQIMLPPTWECDHIIPLWKLGTSNELHNLQALCRECHGIKTMKEAMEREEMKYDFHKQQEFQPVKPKYYTCPECKVKYSPYFKHTQCRKPRNQT
jgi:hypothetical protein